MTIKHIGNNVYYGWKSQGDSRDDINPPIQNAVYNEIDTGIISHYSNNAWNTLTNNTKSDQLFASIIKQLSFTDIGTSYVNVFPSFYNGFPIPIDTTGFNYLGIVMLWNKNGGTGRHDARLVNNANESEVLIHTENMTVENSGSDGLKNGRTKNYGINIPAAFQNFRGELRIQAKSSVATDDPIFDGLLIYLIR